MIRNNLESGIAEEDRPEPGTDDVEEEQSVIDLPSREAMTVIGFPSMPPLEPPAVWPTDPVIPPE